MRSGSGSSDKVADRVIARNDPKEASLNGGVFFIKHIRNGKVIEEFVTKNLVVIQGLDYQRSVVFLDGTPIDPWHLALIDGSPTIAAADTYETQAGWEEVTAYDEASRPAWQGATGATGVVTNSGDVAEFTIASGGATVGGVALVGGGSAAGTKGDTAGGGTLFSASAFTGGNRVLSEGDTLQIVWQHTHSNA